MGACGSSTNQTNQEWVLTENKGNRSKVIDSDIIFKEGYYSGNYCYPFVVIQGIYGLKLKFNSDGTVTGQGSTGDGSFHLSKGYYSTETMRLAFYQCVNPPPSELVNEDLGNHQNHLDVYRKAANCGNPFKVECRLQWNDKKKKFIGQCRRYDHTLQTSGEMEIEYYGDN